MRTPNISQRDEDEVLVAVLAALEPFQRALLPLSLISTVTLAGMMLRVLT
jgi:hypothetical protein